jgi:4-aminobutyrate aminotransferase
LCRGYGILLVAEEVQTGIGRTGRWFASEHFGLDPDILIVGKALASGMPVSAIVARSDLMDHWSAPGHVFCTAANPICCAAAIETLAVIEDEQLLQNAQEMGRRLEQGLRELAKQHQIIGDVRGRGLMLGADLVEDQVGKRRATRAAAAVVAASFARGLYLTFLRGSVLRIAPPLTISQAEVDRALGILDLALEDAMSNRVSEAEIAAVVGW